MYQALYIQRVARKWSQKDTAKKLDITVYRYKLIEKNPDVCQVNEIVKFMKLYELKPDHIWGIFFAKRVDSESTDKTLKIISEKILLQRMQN